MYKALSFGFFFSLNIGILAFVGFLTSNYPENRSKQFANGQSQIQNIEDVLEEKLKNDKISTHEKLDKDESLEKKIIVDIEQNSNETKVDVTPSEVHKLPKANPDNVTQNIKTKNSDKSYHGVDKKNIYIVQYGVFSSNNNIKNRIDKIKKLLRKQHAELDLRIINNKGINFKIVSLPMSKLKAQQLCKESKIQKIECYVRKE